MDKLLSFLIGAIAVLLGGFVIKTFTNKGQMNTKTAEEERRAVKDEIEKTPAADLVDVAANADELHGAADRIKNRGKQRLWDRIGAIISRLDDSGDHSSGGE